MAGMEAEAEPQPQSQSQSQQLFTFAHITVAVVSYWLLATAYHFIASPSPPTSIPWVGYGKGWIAGVRNFTALTKSKEWLAAGYERYSRCGKMFVLPATLGMVPEIIMPRSQLVWMFEQPDSVLSVSEAHFDVLQGDYSFVDRIILKDPYHEHVVHKNLPRNLNAMLPGLEEEVPFAVEDIYGTDTENWKTVDVLQSFMKMIPTLTNKMLLGKPLCRERRYLDAVLSFTTDVIRVQSAMFLVPKALHPIFGGLLGLANWYHYWLSSKFTLPMIKKRIEEIERKDSGDPEFQTWKEPNDFITWSYRTAQAEGRRDEMQPDRIAQRIMPINFASIHTTSITAYETMANVMYAGADVIDQLREEAHRILNEEGSWTKAGLSRMHRIDSAIRESQRVAPIALTFAHRKVVAKEGVTTPEGVHVKYGAMLSCPWTPLARDEEKFEHATEFDAFRYSRPREEFEAMDASEKEKINALKLKQTGLVTTAVDHLAFGHGRHACPGRFFVSHELKIIFAHLLLNYDFKPLVEKPKKLWVVRFQVPLPVLLEVKRRKTMWTPEAH